MNIYARFFDHDTLVHNVDELLDFLGGLSGISLTPQLVDDIRAYVDSDMPYPKRYKVRPRIYFILIKTTAETMEEFKAHRKDNAANEKPQRSEEDAKQREERLLALNMPQYGWYQAKLLFKRVLPIPGTNKFQYQDTEFQALILAQSGQDCYNRLVSHLKNRPDVDMRSQFPSTKGSHFRCYYIGQTIPVPADDDTPAVAPEDTPAAPAEVETPAEPELSQTEDVIPTSEVPVTDAEQQ